ncbi:hypothetical protein BKA69DRAFT_1070091 [Paraphysoderma sedebokerense]|nr:hypothetical protein BKA69DRAFT_1070091 [Paraphysoderma sedebokerense]
MVEHTENTQNGKVPAETSVENSVSDMSEPLTPPLTPTMSATKSAAPTYYSLFPSGLIEASFSSIKSHIPVEYLKEKLPEVYGKARTYAVDLHPAVGEKLEIVETRVADVYNKTKEIHSLDDAVHIATELAVEAKELVAAQVPESVSAKVHDVTDKVIHTKTAITGTVNTTKGLVTSQINSAQSMIAEKVTTTRGLVQSTVHDVTEKVNETVNSTKHLVTEKVVATKDKVASTVHSTAERYPMLNPVVSTTESIIAAAPSFITSAYQHPRETSQKILATSSTIAQSTLSTLKSKSPVLESVINTAENKSSEILGSLKTQSQPIVSQIQPIVSQVQSTCSVALCRAGQTYAAVSSKVTSSIEVVKSQIPTAKVTESLVQAREQAANTYVALSSKVSSSIKVAQSEIVTVVSHPEVVTQYIPAPIQKISKDVIDVIVSSPHWNFVSQTFHLYAGAFGLNFSKSNGVAH